jgi:hypothetical protein
MTQTIVGREAELASIQAFVGGEQWPGTLLLAADAGMGKSTLWRAATERAEGAGWVVLAARPLETETKLAYAGVGDLLATSHDAFEELPPPQAQALRAALLVEVPVGASIDERAVSLGFLGVLRVRAQTQPVLVAVDDVQWLDRASARVLLFAARRVKERVGFLLALREEARGRLSFAPAQVFPEYAELRLGPLGLEDVHAIVQQRLGFSLPRPALRSVHETAAGNPFYALELARATGDRNGATLPSTLHDLVGARVAALPAETRRALAAAAALADPTLELVGAAIGHDAGQALAAAFGQEVARRQRRPDSVHASAPRRRCIRERGKTRQGTARGARRPRRRIRGTGTAPRARSERTGRRGRRRSRGSGGARQGAGRTGRRRRAARAGTGAHTGGRSGASATCRRRGEAPLRGGRRAEGTGAPRRHTAANSRASSGQRR